MTGSKYSKVKNVVLAAAILGGMSSVAGADDSSMSRLTGDSYVYFNATRSDASVDPAWRLSHPNGLTQSELQARVNGVWAQRAHEPVFSKVADDRRGARAIRTAYRTANCRRCPRKRPHGIWADQERWR